MNKELKKLMALLELNDSWNRRVQEKREKIFWGKVKNPAKAKREFEELKKRADHWSKQAFGEPLNATVTRLSMAKFILRVIKAERGET